MPSPNEIWFKSTDFNGEFIIFARNKGYAPDEMYEIPIYEQIEMMQKYLTDNPF